METLDTLSQRIDQLNREGYTEDLNGRSTKGIWLDPTAFTIDAIYRFEGASDPADQMILYALSSDRYAVRGILVNAYGPYADTATAALEQSLHRSH